MESVSAPMTRQLAALAAILDNPGVDLAASLTALTGQLRAEVPGVLGLTITVDTGGLPVTLTSVEPAVLGAAPAGEYTTDSTCPRSLPPPVPPIPQKKSHSCPGPHSTNTHPRIRQGAVNVTRSQARAHTHSSRSAAAIWSTGSALPRNWCLKNCVGSIDRAEAHHGTDRLLTGCRR